MSTLHRTENSGTPAVRTPGSPTAGIYFTDEVFLYRVVGTLPSEGDEVIEIEDCYWLDVVEIPLRDLRARRLRVVSPSSTDD